jgi:hypothetical protein
LERATLEQYLAATRNSRRLIVAASARHAAHVIDPIRSCFDSSGLAYVERDGKLLYFDDDHVTRDGARLLIGPLLEPVLAGIAASEPVAAATTREENARE